MFTKKKYVLITFCVCILISLLLCGCVCDHEWQRSTCQTPRTCIRCGQTEGKLRAHEWGSTDCRDPKGCVVCGTLEGIVLSHEWQDTCKICIHCGYDARPADDRFIDQLAAGLEDRWTIETELMKGGNSSLTQAEWERIFAAEYERLLPFIEEQFQDETLEALALKYIATIEASIKSLERFDTDAWEAEYQSDIYWEQAAVLFEINSLRTISVTEKHEETLETLVEYGEIITMVKPLFNETLFLNVKSTKDGDLYETTIKNTTSLTFQWFSFDINLLDADGAIVDTVTAKVTAWKPEEKARFSFVAESEFRTIEVTYANWKLNR